MSWQQADAQMIELIAAFAGAIGNPAVWLLVLAAVAGRRRIWLARLAAVGIGIAVGLLDAVIELTGRNWLTQVAGCILGAILLGELMLQVVLPAWRFALRCLDLALSMIRRWFSPPPG